MILIDTGPLVALIDKADKDNHQKCRSIFRSLRQPIYTTWPCITEAMYFLGDKRGWKGQAALWTFFSRGAIHIHSPGDEEWKRVRELMEQYKDTPMDFADASLVTLAEETRIKRIFTLDRDFRVYRINGKEPFDVIPPDV
jgi:predicted nucleic acid-binding protein